LLQEISSSFNHANSTSDEIVSSTDASTTSSEETFFLKSSNA
jgi:hypothetical protein